MRTWIELSKPVDKSRFSSKGFHSTQFTAPACASSIRMDGASECKPPQGALRSWMQMDLPPNQRKWGGALSRFQIAFSENRQKGVWTLSDLFKRRFTKRKGTAESTTHTNTHKPVVPSASNSVVVPPSSALCNTRVKSKPPVELQGTALFVPKGQALVSLASHRCSTLSETYLAPKNADRYRPVLRRGQNRGSSAPQREDPA